MKKQRDVAKVAAQIRSDIDDVLCIDFVESNQVDAYLEDLDRVLKGIVSLGETSPAAALELVWRFIKKIPSVFNNVHDECELAMFCSDLAQTALNLTKKAANPIEDSALRLLEAYVADAHDTCRFDDVLELLTRERLNKENRRLVADIALRTAQAHPKSRLELHSLADKILQPTSVKIGRGERACRNR
jgi:hypothetical protein